MVKWKERPEAGAFMGEAFVDGTLMGEASFGRRAFGQGKHDTIGSLWPRSSQRMLLWLRATAKTLVADTRMIGAFATKAFMASAHSRGILLAKASLWMNTYD